MKHPMIFQFQRKWRVLFSAPVHHGAEIIAIKVITTAE